MLYTFLVILWPKRIGVIFTRTSEWKACRGLAVDAKPTGPTFVSRIWIYNYFLLKKNPSCLDEYLGLCFKMQWKIMKFSIGLIVCFAWFAPFVSGNGFLKSPTSRSSVWRYFGEAPWGNTLTQNTEDMALNCGGTYVSILYTTHHVFNVE